jgi:pSer/pThr/pTyr-binding forkhead associated (FHA) protein
MPQQSNEDYTLFNICRNCGHKNRPGDLVCQNCGTMLVDGMEHGPGTKKLDSDEGSASQQAQTASDQLVFPVDAKIAIKLKEVDEPMIYEVTDSITIGRYDKTRDHSPEVDMHRYAGYLLGVSREHARLHRNEERLLLEDLGSSNGTFLNGRRLPARTPTPVPDRSTIRVGDMYFTVFFQV